MHFNSIYSFRNNKNTASYGINTEDVQFEAFVQFPNVITAYFEMQPDGVHEKEDEEKKRSWNKSTRSSRCINKKSMKTDLSVNEFLGSSSYSYTIYETYCTLLYTLHVYSNR